MAKRKGRRLGLRKPRVIKVDATPEEIAEKLFAPLTARKREYEQAKRREREANSPSEGPAEPPVCYE